MPVIILTCIYSVSPSPRLASVSCISSCRTSRASEGLAVLLVLKLFFPLLCQFQLCFPVPSGSLFITMILENLVSSFTLQCWLHFFIVTLEWSLENLGFSKEYVFINLYFICQNIKKHVADVVMAGWPGAGPCPRRWCWCGPSCPG